MLSSSHADHQKPAQGSSLRDSGAPRLFIIIDEYDNFTNQLITARQDALYHDLTTGDSFLRTFFKVIKSGCNDAIRRVFITGVLPVTIDDLTSGFNIAQILTLDPEFENMMGFTQTEVDRYLDAIFEDYAYPSDRRRELGETLRSHYNGYRFRSDAEETLYNSTSLNYYLQKLTLGNGRQPRELVDENLRMDSAWLERLAGSSESALEAVDRLVLEGSLPASVEQLASKFSMSRFLDPKFLPVALFYLGQLTYKDEFALGFPNLTVKKIFIGYYDELHRLDSVDIFAPLFQRFTENGDWAALFAGYWEHYIRSIPAQTFDKANENFHRSTFFALCSRYLQRYFVFNAELNLPSGRADLVAYGRTGEIFAAQLVLFMFKHLSRERANKEGLASWTEARPEDVAQADRYIGELLPVHPGRSCSRHLVYSSGYAEYRFF